MGCDFSDTTVPGSFSLFQSTHPRGVRLLDHVRVFRRRHISIHAPAWGATPASAYCAILAGYFNPRTRVGCDGSTAYPQSRPRHFNPRTRVGCDAAAPQYTATTVPISIHAPAWGATDRLKEIPGRIDISIHAPAWGATLLETGFETELRISIHAPAWGATSHSGLSPVATFAFQSTHPRGVRRAGVSGASTRITFQSTHPRGVRLGRTRSIQTSKRISIHAPAWGAT